MPCLDYDSRIQFNLSLPPAERMCRRMRKDDIMSHELCVMTKLVMSQVTFINDTTHVKKKSLRLIDMINSFRKGQRGVPLIQNNPGLAEVIVGKLHEVLDTTGNAPSWAKGYFKRKIVRIAGILLSEIMEMTPERRLQQQVMDVFV